MTEDTFEQAQFELFMESRTAQLLDFAKPYIGRLVTSQRDAFLETALNKAWENRAALKPHRNKYGSTTVDVLRWWEDRCLRPTALSRQTWDLRTYDRQIETVSGRQLGKRGML
jgi:hypothetical protein